METETMFPGLADDPTQFFQGTCTCHDFISPGSLKSCDATSATHVNQSPLYKMRTHLLDRMLIDCLIPLTQRAAQISK